MPAPLVEPPSRTVLPANLKLDGDSLGARVGGHDAAREVVSAVRTNLHLRDAPLDILHRQRTPDDAGG